METVSVTRALDVTPDALREAISDLGPFMRGAEFDEVVVEDDTIRITNVVGIVEIELVLDVVDDPDSVLTYEQREGIFESMRTAYTVTGTAGGAEITATTDFALDVAIVGGVLDATVITRQRRKELEAQFDWLEGRT